ncbi:MAG: redoxin family protein [Pseudomonadota bacterium]
MPADRDVTAGRASNVRQAPDGHGVKTAAWPWPVPVDDGAAQHLSVGAPVADVMLMATDGTEVCLARHPRPAIVFVYPYMGRPGRPDPPGWDDIAGAHGSTPQALGFAQRANDFEGLGFDVFGLSSQTLEAQMEAADRLALSFCLLNDSSLAFAGSMKLPTFNAGGSAFLSRLTVVISDGLLRDVIYPVHPPDRHAADLLKRLST